MIHYLSLATNLAISRHRLQWSDIHLKTMKSQMLVSEQNFTQAPPNLKLPVAKTHSRHWGEGGVHR